jgi:glycosyltransferase involved in cell wall biosynthesis
VVDRESAYGRYLCAMRILLDCRPLQDAGADSELTRTILSCAASPIAGAGGEPVEWLYLVDHRYRRSGIPGLPDPGPSLLIRRAFPGKPGWKWWYERQVPQLAKQYKVDGVMLTGGKAVVALAVPQYIWMTGGVDRRAGRLSVTLDRAAAVFCFSEEDRSILLRQAGAGAAETVVRAAAGPGVKEGPGVEAGSGDKIVLVRPEPDSALSPLTFGEREAIKSAHAGGKEYFLVLLGEGGQKDRLNLLKAFSLFKKRQRSNMQLVIIDRDPPSGRDWQKKLDTYKYREDLHLVDPPLAAGIGAGAYALLFPGTGGSLGVPLLNAWKAGVPVIAGTGGRLAEICGEAAMYGGPEDPAALAGQMMLLYKDEVRRNGLIEKGRERLDQIGEDGPWKAVWKAIQKIN